MVAKSKLTQNQYEKQISGLNPWKPQGKKALKGHLAVKVDAEALAMVKEIEGWQDRVRAFIEELAREKNSDRPQETSNSTAA
jgi:hypothetical protein